MFLFPSSQKNILIFFIAYPLPLAKSLFGLPPPSSLPVYFLRRRESFYFERRFFFEGRRKRKDVFLKKKRVLLTVKKYQTFQTFLKKATTVY